jgi:hypothetical protein
MRAACFTLQLVHTTNNTSASLKRNLSCKVPVSFAQPVYLFGWSTVKAAKPLNFVVKFIGRSSTKYETPREISGCTAASIKMAVFWDVAPCSLVDIDRRFRAHLWNVGQFLQDYTAQHPRRQSSLWNASSCNFLSPAITSSLYVQILSAPCSQIPSICVLSLWWETKSHTQTRQQLNLLLLSWIYYYSVL